MVISLVVCIPPVYWSWLYKNGEARPGSAQIPCDSWGCICYFPRCTTLAWRNWSLKMSKNDDYREHQDCGCIVGPLNPLSYCYSMLRSPQINAKKNTQRLGQATRYACSALSCDTWPIFWSTVGTSFMFRSPGSATENHWVSFQNTQKTNGSHRCWLKIPMAYHCSIWCSIFSLKIPTGTATSTGVKVPAPLPVPDQWSAWRWRWFAPESVLSTWANGGYGCCMLLLFHIIFNKEKSTKQTIDYDWLMRKTNLS